jgi:hypothetical protein
LGVRKERRFIADIQISAVPPITVYRKKVIPLHPAGLCPPMFHRRA